MLFGSLGLERGSLHFMRKKILPLNLLENYRAIGSSVYDTLQQIHKHFLTDTHPLTLVCLF